MYTVFFSFLYKCQAKCMISTKMQFINDHINGWNVILWMVDKWGDSSEEKVVNKTLKYLM